MDNQGKRAEQLECSMKCIAYTFFGLLILGIASLMGELEINSFGHLFSLLIGG
jgi:hypothetical protein